MESTPITQKFVEALNRKFAGHQTLFGVIVFDVIADDVYDKITLPKWDDSPHGSAHAFIERETGKIFKAASWKYPVMDSKFDLGDEGEFAKAVDKSDPYGTYLETRNKNKSYTSPYGYGIENENPHKIVI